ncbi:hypothetical protein CHS0354_037990 [Potamilus streckersoni]|uniref:FAM20 C-terminal domain-containing protein n=1 Tax=Potamilus streckersoni TaxID=2493646 RepID=A0AAE0T7A9_9BIVA|nr:hypothetical protein CHS0354_037990 [Potamilus streckersoni]
MTMKLKVRATVIVFFVLALSVFYLAVSKFPLLYERTYRLSDVQVPGRRKVDGFDSPHVFTFRKRLNKSNYSSDNNISLEGENVRHEEERNETDLNAAEEKNGNGNNFPMKYESRNKYRRTNTENSVTNYTDPLVDKLVHFLQKSNGIKFNFDTALETSYSTFLRQLRKRGRRRGSSLPIFRTYNGGSHMSNWEKFQKGIHQYGLYLPEEPAIEDLMKDMTREPIVDIEQKEGGTQLKLIITYSDEGQALFKPMRYAREQETLPDHFYFVDFERHNAEIAAFHLDKILGFYRVPPTIGREVNLTSEIKRLADTKLRKTFFVSPAGNVCFHGSCSYYCDTSHAVCGHPVIIEGSFATFLPPDRIAPRKTWRNPWKRSYSKHRKAYWEVYDDLCSQVIEKPPYNTGRRLLDVIDTHIFDFLTGNMDRHHYETFNDFGNNTFLLHLDNGRGFGKANHDEMSILAPVYQCCLIRYSTFLKMTKLYLGPDKLSDLMRESMSSDSINPVLTDSHLNALDRRIAKIIRVIHDCIEQSPYTDVIVDDFF